MTSLGNKQTIANNIKYYLERSGKTQREVAEVVGVAPSTFNAWMKSVKYPRIDKIEIMANYFGIKKSDLIEEKELKENAVTMAQLHFEMTEDEDYVGMFPDFKKLDAGKRKIVISLVHDLAETKTEA